MITDASHLNIPLQKSVPPMSKKKIINRNVITDIIYSHFGYCRESVLQNAIDELIDYFNDISVDKQKLIKQRRLFEKIAYQYNIDGFNAEPFDYAIECLDILADIYGDAIKSWEIVYDDKRIN